ncbi:biotin--protein ligase-like [Stylophora pistillata]|nr:biotin--protein ligase-like [Stylophora pistillata]
MLGAGWLVGFALTKLRILNLTSSCTKVAGANEISIFRSSPATRLTSHVSKAMTTKSSKPPNILIYTGNSDTEGRRFTEVKKALSQVINLHSYVMYRIYEQQITTHPWVENTALLVLGNSDSMSSKVRQVFVKYLESGGQILSLCSPFMCQVVKKPLDKHLKPFIGSFRVNQEVLPDAIQDFSALCQPYYFEGEKAKIVAEEETSRKPVVIQISEGSGNALFSLVHFESFTDYGKLHGQEQDAGRKMLVHILKLLGISCQPLEVPELTPLYLLANEQDKKRLMQSLRSSLEEGICKGNQLSLHFGASDEMYIPNATEEKLPVICQGENSKAVTFNWSTYQKCLSTKVLGKVVLYTDIITSTQTVFDGNYTFTSNIPEDLGIVVIAGQQVKGQGRGGNVWLSPSGCLMFSLHVRIPFASNLGRRLPYLQHIASLAAVEAITSQPGYEDINIRLKWPNDVYYGQKIKIGGVIVTSSAKDNILSAVMGMGINISNTKPTISVNEIISLHNSEHGTNLKQLTTEEMLARTVNKIETLFEDFQENGSAPFLKKYYNRWLHSEVTVNLSANEDKKEVVIKGLDEFGFLLVQTKSGESLSVQPDGNTFDMLKNLIAIKNS